MPPTDYGVGRLDWLRLQYTDRTGIPGSDEPATYTGSMDNTMAMFQAGAADYTIRETTAVPGYNAGTDKINSFSLEGKAACSCHTCAQPRSGAGIGGTSTCGPEVLDCNPDVNNNDGCYSSVFGACNCGTGVASFGIKGDGVTGYGAFYGAALAVSGDIYMTPYDAPYVGVFNPKKKQFSRIDMRRRYRNAKFSGAVSRPRSWTDDQGVTHSLGQIFFAPHNHPKVGMVDVETNTYVESDVTASGGNGRYVGGVYVPENDKIYFIPQGVQNIGVVDCSTINMNNVIITGGTFSAFSTIPISSDTTYRYGTGILAPNNKIYMLPQNFAVGVFTYSTSAFETIAVPNGADNSYLGGALAPNGKIYVSPKNANNIGVIDPTTNSWSTIDISGLITSTNKFMNCALSTNGKIYFAPRNSENFGVLDPSTNTFSISEVRFHTGTEDKKFYETVAGADGNIYGIPGTQPRILILIPGNRNPAYIMKSGVLPMYSSSRRRSDRTLVTFTGGSNLNLVNSKAKVVTFSGTCADSPAGGTSEAEINTPPVYMSEFTEGYSFYSSFAFTTGGNYKLCYQNGDSAYTEVSGTTVIAGDATTLVAYGVTWTTHADKTSPGYACGDSTVHSTLNAAKIKCLQFGPLNCKSVTCNSAGDECILRASDSLSVSSASENTYTSSFGKLRLPNSPEAYSKQQNLRHVRFSSSHPCQSHTHGF